MCRYGRRELCSLHRQGQHLRSRDANHPQGRTTRNANKKEEEGGEEETPETPETENE